MPPDHMAVGMRAGRRVLSRRSVGAVVSFVHHWPPTFNIGDYLCSPRHYFEFACLPPEESGFSEIAVVGGGAFNDLGLKVAADCGGQRNVAWGIGRSIRFADCDLAEVPQADAYAAAGWRDRDLCGAGATLVPCVSVFNDIVDIPPGTDTGVFLNANPAASGAGADDLLGQNAISVTGTNALGEAELRARFARTGRIVTNSYHIAYWGLISGRSVALAGYSSKFPSLLDLLGLPPAVAEYERGDGAGLCRAVGTALEGRSYLRLEAPERTKEEFRARNLDFANELVRKGLFAAASLLKVGPEAVRRREAEIWSTYRLSLAPPG